MGKARYEQRCKNDSIFAKYQAAALPWNMYRSIFYRKLQDKEITQKTVFINRLRWIKYGTSTDQSEEHWERLSLKITRQHIFSQHMKLCRDLHKWM